MKANGNRETRFWAHTTMVFAGLGLTVLVKSPERQRCPALCARSYSVEHQELTNFGSFIPFATAWDAIWHRVRSKAATQTLRAISDIAALSRRRSSTLAQHCRSWVKRPARTAACRWAEAVGLGILRSIGHTFRCRPSASAPILKSAIPSQGLRFGSP